MTMLRHATVLVLALIYSFTSLADEIDLYGADGRAVAYIDTSSEFEIYLWSGTPVAYLDGNNVYGFNGKHTGFFSQGVIFDHSGHAVCAVREALTIIPAIPPIKSIPQIPPIKSIPQIPPIPPIFSNQFSRTPCAIHLSMER